MPDPASEPVAPGDHHEARAARDGRHGRLRDLGGIAGDHDGRVREPARADRRACPGDDVVASRGIAHPRGERADDQAGGSAAGHALIIGPGVHRRPPQEGY
jgi:hypothetical protein